MPATLSYGSEFELQFDDSQDTLYFECCSDARPLINLPAAVEQAAMHPLESPPLTQAIVPGDKVVLALDKHVPQGRAVAAAVFDLLIQGGVSAEDITLLTADANDVPSEGAWAGLKPAVVHDPTRRDQMAYLAATAAGEPLYLNRLLCDADVVVPITKVRMTSHGVAASDGLYPVFSNTQSPDKGKHPSGRRRQRLQRQPSAERPDACWLLGVPCLIQLVPGPGGSASAILAGEPHAVRAESSRQCEAAWRFSVPQRASLVVAAIQGDSSQQGWRQFDRALDAAMAAVADEGAIAICCTLADEPGLALQALIDSDDRFETLRAIRRQNLPDARIARRLVRASTQATVYLLSDLDSEMVEQLGMAPVEDADEITRLASHHPTCVLLANAQHARAMPEE